MGARGPAGKRDAERRRRNTPDTPTITVDLSQVTSDTVEIPAPDEEWHETALAWYMSLTKSGQAIFFEPSDWMVAHVLAGQLSLELKPRQVALGQGEDTIVVEMVVPMPGAKLNAILKGFTMLMATEGDRRRLSIEINRSTGDETAAAGVTNISSKRREHLA